MGVVRNVNGKLVKRHKSKGYHLMKDGEHWFIRPPRLLYAALHGVSPADIRNVVIIEVNGVPTLMTRAEHIRLLNSRRKYSTQTPDEAIEHYKKIIRFAQMVLDYYETGNMENVVNELSKQEVFIKNYIRKNQFSFNDYTINEAWDCIFHEIISKMHDGRISMVDPHSYLLKSVRVYFKNLSKTKRMTVQLEDCCHQFGI